MVYGITLPEDFKTFYRFTDGFETEEDMFNMISLEEIIENKKKGAPFWIAEYMIYCDEWCLEINPAQVNQYDIVATTFDRGEITLTNSLGKFISRFLTGGLFEIGGLYAWADEIKAKLYGNTDSHKIKPSLWVYRECLKRGIMSKKDVIGRADWIIATEEDPDYFFIKMSLSRNLDELITVLDSIHLADDILQIRALFGYIDARLSVDAITIGKALGVLDAYKHHEQLAVFERNEIMGLIVESDYLYEEKADAELEKQLIDDVRSFFRNYSYFFISHHGYWEKANSDLLQKFENKNK